MGELQIRMRAELARIVDTRNDTVDMWQLRV
jgi:hypothetical protein